MTYSEMFTWYLVLGYPICFWLIVKDMANKQGYVTVKDIIMTAIASILPFFREFLIVVVLPPGEYKVWVKK